MNSPKSLRSIGRVLLLLCAVCFAPGCEGSGDGGGDGADDLLNAGGSAGNSAVSEVSDFQGNYVGLYQMGDRTAIAEGWGEATVDADGHMIINVAPAGSAGLSLMAEDDIGVDGGVAFSLAGTGTVDSYVVDYVGAFRLEGNNAFLWGEWTSSSGATGFWGGYRVTNQYPIDASIPALCPGLVMCVDDEALSTIEQCQPFLHCALGYLMADGSECYEFMSQNAEAFLGVTSEAACPDMSGWEAPAACRADPGLCGYVVLGG